MSKEELLKEILSLSETERSELLSQVPIYLIHSFGVFEKIDWSKDSLIAVGKLSNSTWNVQSLQADQKYNGFDLDCSDIIATGSPVL